MPSPQIHQVHYNPLKHRLSTKRFYVECPRVLQELFGTDNTATACYWAGLGFRVYDNANKDYINAHGNLYGLGDDE